MSTNLIKYSKNSTHDFSPFLVLFEKLNSFRFFFFTSTSSINEESVEQTSSSMEIAFLDSTCTSWVAEGRFVASKVPSDAEAFGLRNSSKLISWVKDRTKAFVVGFTLMFDWLADFEWFDVGLTDGSFGSKSSGNDLWKNVCRILNIVKKSIVTHVPPIWKEKSWFLDSLAFSSCFPFSLPEVSSSFREAMCWIGSSGYDPTVWNKITMISLWWIGMEAIY